MPLPVEEARELMGEALTDVDRNTLLAERAEAEAQLRAAEATLGLAPPTTNGRASAGEEPDSSAQNPVDMDQEPTAGPTLDVAALRRAAARARAADDLLARAASEAAERPLSATDPVAGPGSEALGGAEEAFARAVELGDDVPAAWRRLVGAMISATGMAIVIGALGWDVYWLLVPIALIAIMTVDLRVAGKAAREASAEAAEQLALVGVAGAAGGLDGLRQERARMGEAETRLEEARAGRDAAYAEFASLAPGRLPSEVDDVIAEHDAEVAARAVAAPEAVEPDASAVEEAVLEPAATAAPETLPKADWWFGDEPSAEPAAEPVPAEPAPVPAPPVPAPVTPTPAPVRALAERLSKEGREALARIEVQLAALDRVELAKKSLEWHEAQADGEPSGS